MSVFVNIVIPSTKDRVLNLKYLNCPVSHYVTVIKGVHGISKAGNECFKRVKKGLVVLTGDDIIIKPEAWNYLLDVNPGEFSMLETGDFPINGVMSIHKKDFLKVGGFGECQKYSSSDREFFSNAVLKGLKYKPVPLNLVKHIKHPTRSKNIHNAFRVTQNNMEFVFRYFARFPRYCFFHDFVNRFRRGQFRTLLLEFIYFFKVLVKGVPPRMGIKK